MYIKNHSLLLGILSLFYITTVSAQNSGGLPAMRNEAELQRLVEQSLSTNGSELLKTLPPGIEQVCNISNPARLTDDDRKKYWVQFFLSAINSESGGRDSSIYRQHVRGRDALMALMLPPSDDHVLVSFSGVMLLPQPIGENFCQMTSADFTNSEKNINCAIRFMNQNQTQRSQSRPHTPHWCSIFAWYSVCDNNGRAPQNSRAITQRFKRDLQQRCTALQPSLSTTAPATVSPPGEREVGNGGTNAEPLDVD